MNRNSNMTRVLGGTGLILFLCPAIALASAGYEHTIDIPGFALCRVGVIAECDATSPETFTFPDTPLPTGDGLLTVSLQAGSDVNEVGEFVKVSIEGIFSTVMFIGILPPPQPPFPGGSEQVTIPLGVLATAAVDGSIDVTFDVNGTLAAIISFDHLTLSYPITLQVAINIKPGSFPNSINPKSKGVIPVAVLTTDSFDATTVDPATVLFGATGTEAAPVQSALEDVDGDGDTDMILHFKTPDTGIQCGDTIASLTGETFSGQAIEGSDSINTVGCK